MNKLLNLKINSLQTLNKLDKSEQKKILGGITIGYVCARRTASGWVCDDRSDPFIQDGCCFCKEAYDACRNQ